LQKRKEKIILTPQTSRRQRDVVDGAIAKRATEGDDASGIVGA
jgi:hypothetical protein